MYLQTTVDPNIVTLIVVTGIALLAFGYLASVFLNKRAIDTVQTVMTSTLSATQSLILQEAYYGAYERSELLRTVANVIGVDMLRDTAKEFQPTSYPFTPAPTGAKSTNQQ